MKCQHCGNKLNKYQSKFCSHLCATVHSQKWERVIKLCPTCSKEFKTKKGHRRERFFCSRRCSGRSRKKPDVLCECCNTPTKPKQKFCSVSCQKKKQYLLYIERWKNGKETGKKGLVGVSGHIRRYLFEKYDSKCCKCGWNKINPVSGKIPLEINHKDGNWKNNSENNLELICPNCHSLEPTYKALNKGRGRYTTTGVVNPGNNKRK